MCIFLKRDTSFIRNIGYVLPALLLHQGFSLWLFWHFKAFLCMWDKDMIKHLKMHHCQPYRSHVSKKKKVEMCFVMWIKKNQLWLGFILPI